MRTFQNRPVQTDCLTLFQCIHHLVRTGVSRFSVSKQSFATRTKRLFYIVLAVLTLTGCSGEDELNDADRNVVSGDDTVNIEELLLFISVKITDDAYLVIQSVDSINIYINNRYWNKTNSEPLDTSKIDKQLVGNQYVSANKIAYLVMAPQDIKEPDFDTAGDFADYLNATYELEPGDYACFIESFQLTLADNTVKTYYPMQYISFTVDENSKSAFIGEIELKID